MWQLMIPMGISRKSQLMTIPDNHVESSIRSESKTEKESERATKTEEVRKTNEADASKAENDNLAKLINTKLCTMMLAVKKDDTYRSFPGWSLSSP